MSSLIQKIPRLTNKISKIKDLRFNQFINRRYGFKTLRIIWMGSNNKKECRMSLMKWKLKLKEQSKIMTAWVKQLAETIPLISRLRMFSWELRFNVNKAAHIKKNNRLSISHKSNYRTIPTRICLHPRIHRLFSISLISPTSKWTWCKRSINHLEILKWLNCNKRAIFK